MRSDSIAKPQPAATVMLLRDGDAGMEVFMIVRHHQSDVHAGALVFPGGRVDPEDSERPTSFSAKTGSKRMLMTLQRIAEKDAATPTPTGRTSRRASGEYPLCIGSQSRRGCCGKTIASNVPAIVRWC